MLLGHLLVKCTGRCACVHAKRWGVCAPHMRTTALCGLRCMCACQGCGCWTCACPVCVVRRVHVTCVGAGHVPRPRHMCVHAVRHVHSASHAFGCWACVPACVRAAVLTGKFCRFGQLIWRKMPFTPEIKCQLARKLRKF